MRIGIDATALPPQLAGAGTYIANLIRTLPKVDSENEYIVFVKTEQRSLFAPHPRVERVGVPSPTRPLRVLWEQAVLPWLVRKYRLDLLHSPHYTMPLLKRSKAVVTFHDMTFFILPDMHQPYKRIFFKTMIALSARRADAIIADSENTKRDILQILKLDPRLIYAVPLGNSESSGLYSPREIERVRRQYRLPKKVVLFVGDLEPRKNLPTLVSAFKLLVDREIPHSLVIVGKKVWRYKEIFQTVKKLQLENRVVFTGFVPENDLPFLYKAADLFVYPSFYEGFGLPVLEAMAHGIPVITSNVSSMPEIVGEAGILVDPDAAHTLAEKMGDVLIDHALHEKLGSAGRERAKFFSWERTARETLAVYEQVLRER